MSLDTDSPALEERASPIPTQVLASRSPVLARLALASVPILLVGGLLSLVVVAGATTRTGPGNADAAISTCDVSAATTTVTGLDSEQLRNAATIVAVGRKLAVPPRGLLIALATALQESSLRNLDRGDKDSLGLFQQRAGWGSVTDRTTPTIAVELFYSGGRAGQPGLLDVPGWQSLPLSDAAQAVQRSAFPDAYAAWQLTAQRLLSTAGVGEAACGTIDASNGTVGTAVVNAAERWLGTPYSWGGGDLQGPTTGFGSGAGVSGFDCSSLARYAWYNATSGRVLLPRVTTDQARTGHLLPVGARLAPGDLLFFQDPADPPGVYHHVGIYIGNGAMIHAPHTGAVVQTVQKVLDVPYYRGQFVGGLRPQ